MADGSEPRTDAEPATGSQPRSHRRLWVEIVLFPSAIVAGLIALVLPYVQEAREAARFTSCRCHICQLKTALYLYHDTYGSFPPAFVSGPDGTPWHSWRTLILPYLDHSDVLDQYRFDEPWDGPNNQRLAEKLNHTPFQCMSSAGYESTHFTNYAVVVGRDTMFPGSTSQTLDAVESPDETILFVEVDNLDIHWMEPRDLGVDTMSFKLNSTNAPSISSAHPKGPHVTFVGGNCGGRALDASTSASQIRRWVLLEKTPEEEIMDE